MARLVMSYRMIVRATEPRRLPPGLATYARLEHRGDVPDWWTTSARPARRERRHPRGVVRAIRRVASTVAALLA
ncbi:MAG: hypothetical protein ACT4OI_06585 [Methanobacteriota archaeon]